MTDRELLEQAATAYFGADGFEWNSCAGFAGCIQYIPKGLTHYVEWKPLEDDGDALKLAVAAKSGIEYVVDSWPDEETGMMRSKPNMAATRRAIVTAAAEIGRSLP